VNRDLNPTQLFDVLRYCEVQSGMELKAEISRALQAFSPMPAKLRLEKHKERA
jgi:hypothetical protein